MGVQSFGNPGAAFRNRFGRTGNRASRTAPTSSPISVTGGNTTYTYGGKTIHVWASPGPFVVTGGPANIEYFVVAGGGGGGADMGGGGGGGGVLTGTVSITGPFSATVTVGPGGTVISRNTSPVPTATNGSPSILSIPTGTPIVSTGGGRGGYNPSGTEPGEPGGSGGGGYGQSTSTGGLGTPGQGTPGWGGPVPNGGGGGGAGEPGTDVSNLSPKSNGQRNGGRGLVIPTTFRNPAYPYGGPAHPGQTSYPEGWYFGGGGAGGSPLPGSGYAGGGTQPGTGTGPPIGGSSNTGGGGAGGPGQNGDPGGPGGSGIVFIAYTPG